MIEKSDIEQLSVSEKLKTLEMLWESISSQPEKISSPVWHEDVLKARESKINSEEVEYLTLDELRENLNK
jgi:gamma-glutamyl phosphate reductase